ncbi:MAG TPA: cysteine rich repeat-containing protein [Syntrophales bacterium]|nr:cysteine rich repeat-containing protein [Syntrophales bacterium]
MKRLAVIFCTAAVCFFMLASVAIAQDRDETLVPKSGKGACKADIEKFCKDIKPGKGRIWACLKSNGDRLSRECADHIAQAQERNREFLQACRGDAAKFCKGVTAGKGGIISCLKSHEAELSPACAAAFKK